MTPQSPMLAHQLPPLFGTSVTQQSTTSVSGMHSLRAGGSYNG